MIFPKRRRKCGRSDGREADRIAADKLCATAVHRQARRSPIAAADGGEKQVAVDEVADAAPHPTKSRFAETLDSLPQISDVATSHYKRLAEAQSDRWGCWLFRKRLILRSGVNSRARVMNSLEIYKAIYSFPIVTFAGG